MCGLLGFITKRGEGPDLGRLSVMAAVTEQRGRDAFGLAWVDARGRLHRIKRRGGATKNLRELRSVAGAQIVIGHCRWATHGDQRDHKNNHPHRAGNGWIMHNGVVRNYAELAAEHDLEMRTECDSEVLGLLMAKLGGSLPQRAAVTAQSAEGPLAVLGVWSQPARLLIVRNGNPLNFGTTDEGFYLGSLKTGLPFDAKEVKNGSATLMTHRPGMAIENKQVTLAKTVTGDSNDRFLKNTNYSLTYVPRRFEADYYA